MPRIRSEIVAGILGIGVRCVQKMAVGGRLPTAAKIGKVWTFDEVAIRKFLADAEVSACQTTAFISGTASGGSVPSLPGAKSDRAYELAMSKALAGSATKGSSSSKGRGRGSEPTKGTIGRGKTKGFA